MKICPQCRQQIGEDVKKCPMCGAEAPAGRTHIDRYRILQFVRESRGSIAYRAQPEGETGFVLIRLFKPESGITTQIAARLQEELKLLHELPPARFVRHFGVHQSSQGEWYRVSEWLDAIAWGDLIGSGYFLDFQKAFPFMASVAEGLAEVHSLGCCIPHLTSDDLVPVRGTNGTVSVRIDYKLSRFINPDLPHPSPRMAALLSVHPDILNNAPLDDRTDTWSLGRIFIWLLAGCDEVSDALRSLKSISVPERIKLLIRQMLEEDPELRPQSVAEIAERLRSVSKEELAESDQSAQYAENRSLRARTRWMAVALILVVVAGGSALMLQYKYALFSRDSSRMLSRQAEKYRHSVAFVASVYALKMGGKTVHFAAREGTAFLVGKDGYLLTNRHVACPWLDDGELEEKIEKGKGSRDKLQLESRLLLWFDGQRAIKRIGSLSETDEIDQFLEDHYFVQNAYRSNGSPKVYVAGILPFPQNMQQLHNSPLGDDVACLRIDHVPSGAEPIVLSDEIPNTQPKPLTPVVVMGFPLGADQILGEEALVSLTMGSVRRSFAGVSQIDASMHPGNSGGPVINAEGKLIGIASAVATEDSPQGSQGLSDFGEVLHVSRVLPLLKALRRGEPRWTGVVDYNLDQIRMEVSSLVARGKWAAAEKLVSKEFRQTPDPQLFELQGAIQYGLGRPAEASASFLRLALETPNSDGFARLMLFLIGDRPDIHRKLPQLASLPSASWDSQYEFQGYLARIFKGQVPETDAADGWEDRSEKAFIHWILAKKQAASGRFQPAMKHLEDAILEAGLDTPEFLISMGDLQALKSMLKQEMPPTSIDSLNRARQLDRMQQPAAGQSEKKVEGEENLITALERAYREDPDNAGLLLSIAFFKAAEGNWAMALADVDKYLGRQHRVCANSLAGELLRAELMQMVGRENEAVVKLRRISAAADHPWYSDIARDLLEPVNTALVTGDADQDSARLVTLEEARGLWAEGKGDKQAAIQHYRAALGSYRNNWMEYVLARKRIEQLRPKVDK